MKERIQNYFNRYVEFDEKEIDIFYSHLTSKKFKKKEYLLTEGRICKNNFFITKGLIRTFYLDHKGTEKNRAIWN